MGLLTPLAVRVGAIGWMPRLLPQITWTDKTLQRLTGGRLTILDVAGLPNLMLTVVGRRTGVARSTPLLCVPERHDGAETILIAGSYFGGPKEPLWVANLEAAGECTVRFRRRTTPMSATRLEGPDRAAAWAHMLRTWPNFAKYEERTDRVIKVFRLTAVEA